MINSVQYINQQPGYCCHIEHSSNFKSGKHFNLQNAFLESIGAWVRYSFFAKGDGQHSGVHLVIAALGNRDSLFPEAHW